MSYVTVESPRPHGRVIPLSRPERIDAMSFELVGPAVRMTTNDLEEANRARRAKREPGFLD